MTEKTNNNPNNTPDTRHWENMHIPLWLLKDTCWMMEWRYLGVAMIIPTVLMALYILFKSRDGSEYWVNLAICFWIAANSYWMCSEFFGFVEYKHVAVIPFVLGMISVTIFYIKKGTEKKGLQP